MKNIDIWAPAFFKHNNSFIATVGATMNPRSKENAYQRDMNLSGDSKSNALPKKTHRDAQSEAFTKIGEMVVKVRHF